MAWYHDMFGDINLSLTRKPKTIRKLAEFSNMAAWRMWFSILVQRALHRYKFEGLPETVSERVLRMSLLWHASICFFEEKGHVMALPGGAGTNGVTVYGDYTHCYVYGRNGWNREVKLWVKGENEFSDLANSYLPIGSYQQPDGVWFRENEQKVPFIDVCIAFATDIADTWEKMQNARLLMGKSFIAIGAEEDEASAIKLFKDYTNNVPFIFMTRKMTDIANDVVPLDPSGRLKELSDHLIWQLAQFNRLCGLDDAQNPDKISGTSNLEVLAGLEAARGNVQYLCHYMQENGLDLVNEHFGTSIRVVPDIPDNMKEEENETGEKVQQLDSDPGRGQVGRP